MFATTEWMTRTELAQYLHVSPRTVQRWVDKGILPPPRQFVNHRSLYWRRDVVESWMDDDYAKEVAKLKKSGVYR